MRRAGELNALLDETTGEEPAVGLLATTENAAAVPGAILRARQHGHRVIVTARTPECTGLLYARALGAVVVSPPEDPAVTEDRRERLASIARADGFPGLIYQADPATRVDFQATNEALASSEKFVIPAREEPAVGQDTRVLVGIPAYNEGDAIGAVVRAAARYADDVLVVDDGSNDGTAEAAENAGASVVRHDRNHGYGAALKTLFQQAARSGADHLVVVDGDGQHDVADVSKLVATQRETGAPLVIGSRFGDGADTKMPLYRRIGVGVVNVLTNLSLGIVTPSSWVRDTQSGFRAYDRQAIESLASDETLGNQMSASTDILYHAHSVGYDIKEVPTTIRYDVKGGSSHNPIQHGILLVMNIVRTIERERPITLLGLPGVLCMLFGVGFVYWTVFNYIQSGSFPIGLALAASVCTIAGLLAAFTAVILHSLAVFEG